MSMLRRMLMAYVTRSFGGDVPRPTVRGNPASSRRAGAPPFMSQTCKNRFFMNVTPRELKNCTESPSSTTAV